MMKIHNQKKTAEYQRVSSGGQDLQMQVSTNKEYLSAFNEHEILKFVDYDVSATKLSIENRPALNRMLQTIKEEKISTVVVYERDRLARDVYEYIKIIKTFYEYDVNVIFTASNAPAFSDDIFLETWYGLYSQFEGQKIRTRLYDKNKRYPSKMIGYKKDKQNNGKLFYKTEKGIKDKINKLFYEFSLVETREDLIKVVLTYQSVLARTSDRILEILKTPFFAAHYLDDEGHYCQLDHVEPIISLELFQKVQEIFEFQEKVINNVKTSPFKEAFITPICGICMENLNFRKGKIGQESKYACKKHKKVAITSSELNIQLIQSVKLYIETLSPRKLESLCISSINGIKKSLNLQSIQIQKKIEDKCTDICTAHHTKTSNHKFTKKIEGIKKIRDVLLTVEDQLAALENLKEEVSYIATFLKEKSLKHLDNEDYKLLAKLLIAQAVLNDDSLIVHYYFNEFQEGRLDICI